MGSVWHGWLGSATIAEGCSVAQRLKLAELLVETLLWLLVYWTEAAVASGLKGAAGSVVLMPQECGQVHDPAGS